MSAFNMYEECSTCLCGQLCATRGTLKCNPCIDCNGRGNLELSDTEKNDECYFWVSMDSSCPFIPYGENIFKRKSVKNGTL